MTPDRSGGRQDHVEAEDRAAALAILQRQRTAHEVDDPPGDGKPETRAAMLACRRAVGLFELFEDRFAPVGPDPRAGVFDREADAAVGRGLDHEADAAPCRELDRVAGQIGEDLPQRIESPLTLVGRSGARRVAISRPLS